MEQANCKQLKFIAINILDGCLNHIKKNLETNNPYIFNKGYKLQDPNQKGQFNIVLDNNNLRDNFFSYNDISNPKITITAIVGKNGSGKSAIIDLALRLINNLAYKHIPNSQTYSNAEVKWVKGVRAQLYFSKNEKLYLVQQDGDETKNISLYGFEEYKDKYQWRREQSNAMKTLGESFFYTILMNYSLYAFNTFDYKEEWGNKEKEESCWLRGLFHKNDGYQTPAVLNPMRTKGNIDINKENNLAKDRLISLFFVDSEKNNDNFIKINEHTEVVSLSIILDEENVKRKYNNIINSWGEEQVKKTTPDFFSTLKNNIIIEWKKKYKFKPAGDQDLVYETALQYLAYKTISIAQTYDNQLEHSSCLMPINGTNWDSERELQLTKLIAELDKESSHITFKLKQTLAFLIFRHLEPKKGVLHIDIDKFSKLVKDMIDSKWPYLYFVPAPFFKTEILLRNNLNNEVYSFSKISSGERQMIYSASSILYHIRNLNSIKVNHLRIKYKHINLILDEIELYFHPEFQRKYIDYVIKCINSISFLDIESVNILLATHSPFILSDIPESNVLFLNEGKSQKGISETFGSNIHTLYRDNFFISGMPIGEFAKNKILTLFEKANNTKGRDNELFNDIRLVGEPLLRKQLEKIYYKNSGRDLFLRINELESEILELKSKENDTNNPQ
jgi:predicted ATPase